MYAIVYERQGSYVVSNSCAPDVDSKVVSRNGWSGWRELFRVPGDTIAEANVAAEKKAKEMGIFVEGFEGDV